MKTIVERANEAGIISQYKSDYRYDKKSVELGYTQGAAEQKAIDEEVRLKKSDDMTQAEYDREVAFADWYHQNGKGTPTYSDAIEWARKEVIENARDWFSDYLIMEICDANDWLRGSPETGEDRFRKAMEE